TRDDIGHFSMENGYLTAKKLIESDEQFSAVYAVADALAIGAIRALLEAGLRVPDDVSVAGYDGIDVSGYISPSLTTIRQPVEEMAKDTVKLLFDIIAGRKDHQHITYEAELLERESTKEVV
ncbi:MAG: substrate-binding domain-containing protein, partial [Lachnospiraceae bacterium]|nr:substrate-binding domain-containing protein [Lachnospiraceae bacterium]